MSRPEETEDLKMSIWIRPPEWHLLGPCLANVMSLDHIAAHPVTLVGDIILQKVDYFQMLQRLVGNSVILLHQQRLSYWWFDKGKSPCVQLFILSIMSFNC